jgi:predicted DNA-binding mobile mystery protein A
MSTYQLAKRMDCSPTRVRQIEQGELEGSILLSTITRAAEALNCRFAYVLVPNESLEDMVHRQARCKAAASLHISDPDALENEAREGADLERVDELLDLTIHLVDRQGLWNY